MRISCISTHFQYWVVFSTHFPIETELYYHCYRHLFKERYLLTYVTVTLKLLQMTQMFV